MNKRQKALLLLLLKCGRAIISNQAGQHLYRNGLLNKSSACTSNFCLCGSAVLRSLERLGLVYHWQSDRDDCYNKFYNLTTNGEVVAKKLKNE